MIIKKKKPLHTCTARQWVQGDSLATLFRESLSYMNTQTTQQMGERWRRKMKHEKK